MPKSVSKAFLMESKFITQKIIKENETHILNPENLMVYQGGHLVMDDLSMLEIEGKLSIGASCCENYNYPTIIKLDRNAKLLVKGDFQFFYGCDVNVFDNAVFTVGNKSFLNSDCRIRCGKRITIGDDCAISHRVTITDSDFHVLIEDGTEHKRLGEDGITIGNHVWIGTGVTILKDVTIGDGAVIAAGSLVTSDVPPRTVVAGNPAKVIKENIDWRK